MKKYEVLLFDLDGTILDFDRASNQAFKEVFEMFSLPYSDEIFHKYEVWNLSLWEMCERGEIQKEEIFIRRFRDFFLQLHWDVDGAEVQKNYQKLLQKQSYLLPNAREILAYLSKKYEIYFVTNGERVTQQERLKRSGLLDYARGVFISDEVGYPKPDIRYFQYVFDHIKIKDKSKFLLIGDSLTSDMKGALVSQIDSCFVSFQNKKPDIPVTYQISSLLELKNIL